MNVKYRKLTGLLTIILTALLIAGWVEKPRSTSQSLSTQDWKTYKSAAYGFQIRYPSDYEIQAHSADGSPYEKEFLFAHGNSVPLSLRVINLTKYLPTTNTPTIPQYLQTLRSLPKFTQATITGKTAYEYVSCGSTSCSQEVIFIEKETLYDFSIDQPGVKPADVNFDRSPPAIRATIESLTFRNV